MKTFLIAAASALVLSGGLTLAGAASAQDTAAPTSDTSTYGSVGVLGIHSSRTDTKLHGINARVGKKITENFGVEGEAAFGTDKDSTAAGNYKLTHKVAAYGVGYLPVSDKFEFLGRVGVSDTKLKIPDGDPKEATGTSLDYGVGAQYHFNHDYAVRGDLTQSDYASHRGIANTATLSLVKAF